MSSIAINKIRDDFKKQHVHFLRPSWTETFMGIAYVVANRSHDAQSQHGCVITSQDNHILGTGYNGVMAGVDHTQLPNMRPDKYNWMLHAELNAIFNCQKRPDDGIAYVTGHPCLHCFQCLYQVGISKIIYDAREERNANMIDDKMKELLEVAQYLTEDKMSLIPYVGV